VGSCVYAAGLNAAFTEFGSDFDCFPFPMKSFVSRLYNFSTLMCGTFRTCRNMYFDRGEPQPSSTHAVSKPIDILRTSAHRQSSVHDYRSSTSVEKQRPVNRVKPVVVKNPVDHTSISSNNSSISSVQPSQQTRINAENKENCNRMPMIYNLYGKFFL
jgi:hypothetical protein